MRLEGRDPLISSDPVQPVHDHDDDEISIGPYLARLWAYRQVVALGLVLTALTFGLVLAGLALVIPTERLGSLQFRLLFEGAQDGEYPDESPFNPADLTTAPILTRVYEANDLDRFGPYEQFAESMFVLESSPEAALLDYEYEARLADTRLAPADRARIEEEFRRRRALIRDPTFSISMLRHDRLTRLPGALMEKVLLDTLRTWAAQAAERKGASPYELATLSRNILQEGSLENDDYLVAVDSLRVKTQRVIEVIASIEQAPGSRTVRTGGNQPSLAEIRAGLEDFLTFKIAPLLNLIRAEGATKSPRLLALYARSQLFQREQECSATIARIDSLRDALSQYTMQAPDSASARRRAATGAVPAAPGGTPTPGAAAQFGESFLDRLVELSTQTQASDVEYRQRLTDQIIEQSRRLAALQQERAYYNDLIQELGELGASGEGGAPSEVTAASVTTEIQQIFDTLGRAVDDLGDVGTAIAAHNLQPPTLLYSITTPFAVRVQSPIERRQAALYFVLTMFAAFILLPAGCLVYDVVRARPQQAASVPETARP